MSTNQTATTTVYINNEAAKSALIDIENKLNDIKKARQDAFEKGDLTAFDKLDKDAKKLEASGEKLRKRFFDVNAVLKDLSGASLRDLEKALQMANRELGKMRQDDPGWEAQRKKVAALRKAVDEAGAASRRGGENAGVFGKAWSGISGIFGKAIPLIGAAWGTIKGGEAIINSAQALSDKWEKTMAGLNSGFDYLKKSIATMDFSNFFTNIREAIKAGQEYAETLDDLGDRNRALGIQEADSRRYILERMKILRDATKSEQERIKAADEIIAKEDELAAKKTNNAKIAYDAEIKLRATQSRLNKNDLEYYLKNYDQLSANIKKGEEYNSLLKKQSQLSAAISSMAANNMDYTPQMNELKKVTQEINSASSDTKYWGEVVKGVGKLNDEELNKLVELYKNVKEAENSALENTQRVSARKSSLLAETEKKETNTIKNINDAAAKAEEDRLKFESYLQEQSLQQIEEWGKAAEKQIDEIFDKSTKAADDYIDSLKPDEKQFEEIIKTQEQINEIRKQYSQKSKIDEYNETIAFLEKNKDTVVDYENTVNQIHVLKAQERMSQLQEITRLGTELIGSIEDAALSQAELRYQQEVKAAGNNASLKAAAEERYQAEQKRIKKKYADVNFAISVGEIIVDTAGSIMKAYQQLGPIAGTVAAVILSGIGIANIAKANMERQKVKALYTGGYTGSDASDYTPTGVVHANEFVANASAVRNPTVKPVLDIIDMAQRSGTIRSINLPAAVSGNTRGFQDGGYTSPSASAAVQTQQNSNDATNQLLITAIQVMSHLDQKIDNIEARISMEHLDTKKKEWDKFKADVSRS